MSFVIRKAAPDDVPDLARLIDLSARGLGGNDYTTAQIEGALGSAWGVDTQLIRDGTYFVVLDGSEIVACGGWSRRKALFGADALTQCEPELLNPARDAVRIRAFFVHPQWARRGIGATLLDRCETEARKSGFERAELVATLPGVRLYAARGYVAGQPFDFPLPTGCAITFVPMTKGL